MLTNLISVNQTFTTTSLQIIILFAIAGKYLLIFILSLASLFGHSLQRVVHIILLCEHACLRTCKMLAGPPRTGLIPGWQQRWGQPAHVQIFQLRLAMFSLALSALLELGPEKLSINDNSRLPPHPEAPAPSLQKGLSPLK